jgi:hypothetical protein
MIFETFPSILLVVMIAITLILLPYLNDERPSEPEKTHRTDQLPVISKRRS